MQESEKRGTTVSWTRGTCGTTSLEVSPFPDLVARGGEEEPVTEPGGEHGAMTPVSGAGVFECDLEARSDRLCLAVLTSAIRDEDDCAEPAPDGLQDSARGWGPHFASVFWA